MKEDLELIRAENTKIEDKNMFPPSHRLGTARATSPTAVPTFRMFFCCFCFKDKLPDTELASALTYIEVIKFIRFVSTGTVSTFTQ